MKTHLKLLAIVVFIVGGISAHVLRDTCKAKPAHVETLLDHAPDEVKAFVSSHGGRCAGWEHFAKKVKGPRPQCAYCGIVGTDQTIEAHHVHAFESMTAAQRGTNAPGGELDPANIILLCRPDHFVYGHLKNFKKSDPDIVTVCAKHRSEMEAAGTWPKDAK